MKKLSYIILFFFIGVCTAQESDFFEQGKIAYKNENFQEAINNWMKILDEGEHSAALYYNLGNAHYKLNNVGPSVYYYEKALRLDPNDAEVRNNLQFAENAKVDSIEPLPQNIFTSWYKAVSGIFTFNGWAIIAVICSSLAVLLFLLYYFSFSERKKRLLFASSLVSIVILFGAIILAFKTYSDFENDDPAIIFAESAEVKNEPTLGSEVAFMIHEGTKVQILDRDEDWVRIILDDGKDGWIPESDLREL